MSSNNFNNLANLASGRIRNTINDPAAADSTANTSSTIGPPASRPIDGTTSDPNDAGIERLQDRTDWFSDLDSGKSHLITPQKEFGDNPDIDLIVDTILGHLGIGK